MGQIATCLFTLDQFKAVFRVRNPAGLPYILIGGQAVNYWADKFSHVEPELLQFRPFASIDIDLKGNRNDVTCVARQLGVLAKFPLSVEMTALAGVIPVKIGEMQTAIEIVRSIPGVRDEIAETAAVGAEFAGETIRVLDPISLLYCKAELAQKVSQEGRRDVDHLKMLVYCVRAFLRETLHETENDVSLQQGWLGAAERVLSLAESAKGTKLARRFNIPWWEILPEKDIEGSKLPKLNSFREKRLAAWKQKLTGK